MKKLLLTLLLAMGIFTTSSIAETNTAEVENFVSRFYTEVLGRTADAAGLADWTNRLVSGESAGSDVATGFVFSDEFMASDRFKDNTLFVNVLYKAFFNRVADSGGLSGWLAELDNGTSKEDVLSGFLYSEEFGNLCSAYGIKAVPDGSSPSTGGGVEEFVKRFYVEVLGREADAGGLADWVNRLNNGIVTGADIATGFIFSAEFTNRTTDDVTFLEILYTAFFGREADEAGIDGWLSHLEEGVSREEVLSGFLHSDEFVALCGSYEIIAYSNETEEVSQGLIYRKDYVSFSTDLPTITVNPAFNTSNLSISVWIKAFSLSNQNIFNIFSESAYQPNDSFYDRSSFALYSYMPSHSGHKFAFAPWGGTTNGGGTYIYPSNEPAMRINQWYHIVYTVDDTTGAVEVYYNGNKGIGANLITLSGGGLFTDLLNPKIRFGNFDGEIKNLKIYNRVITSSEINTLYQ